MELNREQIIKALECCHSSAIADCKKCPYKGKADCEEDLGITCLNVLIKDTLSLIKELTEENENAREKNKWLNEENERLQKRNAVLIEDNHILSGECIPMAKADTVRKMQERLKARNAVYCINENDLKEMNFVVDQIAKEMLEGEDGKAAQ